MQRSSEVSSPAGVVPPTLALIRALKPSLGPSEGAVAGVILDRCAEIPDWSTQELAAAAGTSAATVVRACQRLGFRGYQHLRLELAREGAPLQSAGTSASLDAVTQSFTGAQEALRLSAAAIDRSTVMRAAQTLLGANRIMFTANGFSAPPLQDAAMRFATVGRPVESPLDILAQQFTAHTLGPDDVCLALTHSGANAHTLATVRAAQQAGATVIVVCSYSHAPIPELADTVIATGSRSSQQAVDPFFSRVNHSVALHALLTAYTELAGRGDATGMFDVVATALSDSAD
ncbi:MurR/RpiR family transcriptional regulator [Leucobacter sp. cx-328]|uniref:MurR/RpiR family transcriptional regulator n=1 Tax=unclassified Leucobacter TaxID=2621730 RepID=UPI00165E191A|nr:MULTISPECIES: MurR/RpiR family transcriptional regulator [unclassified Leucobacter]MBC9943072.1 MurR/RpiR family transcriptional regulator [Leucobacter sp. cx-328]